MHFLKLRKRRRYKNCIAWLIYGNVGYCTQTQLFEYSIEYWRWLERQGKGEERIRKEKEYCNQEKNRRMLSETSFWLV